jgi:hypothetical protein
MFKLIKREKYWRKSVLDIEVMVLGTLTYLKKKYKKLN